MSIPFHLQVPRSLLQGMFTHAETELPNECCGLLAGTPPAPGTAPGIVLAVQRYPLENAARSPTEFWAEPRSLFQAVRTMNEKGWEPLAIYHSHPTSDPIPSRTDLERNYWPGVVSFIISLKIGQPRIQGWWLKDHAFEEASWEVTDL